MTIEQEYKKLLRTYKRLIREYKRQGWKIPEAFELKEPKRKTRGSIRKVKAYKEKAKRLVKVQKLESGYYYTKFSTQSRLQKAKVGKKSQRIKGTASIPKPPNVSDAILKQVESEIKIAENYMGKTSGNKYVEAIREGATELKNSLQISESGYSFTTYTGFLDKLKQSMSNRKSRQELSKIIDETGWFSHFQALENYLYEYEYTQDGSFEHSTPYLKTFAEIMNEVSQKIDISISDDEIDKALEGLNTSEDGFVSNIISGDYI